MFLGQIVPTVESTIAVVGGTEAYAVDFWPASLWFEQPCYHEKVINAFTLSEDKLPGLSCNSNKFNHGAVNVSP